jgi:dTDP-4-dehydrorhamnose 3,5-epimerase
MIHVLDTRFPEAKLIEPDVFADDRGYFKETYSRERYAAIALGEDFVQDNVSASRRNVVRGMHYDPRMAKLVQCLVGKIFDVIVDVRDGYELSGENHRQLYVPRGFAHGFLTLSEEALVSYKQSEYFDAKTERGLAWDDPAIGIAWPLDGEPIVSQKDRAWPHVTLVRTQR